MKIQCNWRSFITSFSQAYHGLGITLLTYLYVYPIGYSFKEIQQGRIIVLISHSRYIMFKYPITENRMFVIEVLGKRKVEKAVHKLCEMLFSQRDTYELIEIVKTLHLIGSNEAISCIKSCIKEARDKINNKILASFIEECLNELYQ